MRKTILDRRTFLKGLLGGAVVSIAIPPLEAMLDSWGTAYAGGAPIPKRFGLFFWGNGVRLDRWVPATVGRSWTPSSALMPLADLVADVSVVSGMEVRSNSSIPHQPGTTGILCGAPPVDRSHVAGTPDSTFALPSIDQVIARAIGRDTRFLSLEAGVSRRAASWGGTTLRYLSHNGPDSANPPEYSPHVLFNRVFGPVFRPPGTPAGVDPRAALRRSVLDAVAADARDLRGRLGAVDRLRLDEHLESVRAIERTLTSMPIVPSSACLAPADPGDFPEIEGREPLEEVNRAMSELLVLAMACDQTRVASLRFSSGADGSVLWPAGVTVPMHELTHEEPGEQPMVHACVVYIMERLADFLRALRRIPIGDGNLLDHSCILATTDVAEGYAHSVTDYPILVAGRAGGALRSGVHYRSSTGENASKVLLTIAQAMDVGITGFGGGVGYTTETLPAIQG